MKLTENEIQQICSVLHSEVQFYNSRGREMNGAILHDVAKSLRKAFLEDVVKEKLPESEPSAAERDKLRKELENIANAKPRGWDDPSEFTAWAQSRARHALNSL